MACRRIAGRKFATVSVAGLASFITACERHLPDESLVRVGDRLYQRVAWDTTFVAGGTLQDSALLLPRLMTAGDGRLYVYDYGDQRLKAFDGGGNLLWQYGHRGEGPGEFRNPLDLEVSPASDVWVFDGGTGRITVLSPSGGVLRMMSPGIAIRDVLPLRGKTIVSPVAPGEQYWLELDSLGQPVSSGRYPLPELNDAAPLVRQTYSTVGRDGRTWATIFPFGNVFLVHKDTALACHGTLIEGAPFPDQAGPDMPIWAAAAALADSSLFVLARGTSDDALQILDEYSLVDCAYRRTLRLPRKVRALATDGRLFYISYEDPAPTILGITMAGQ